MNRNVTNRPVVVVVALAIGLTLWVGIARSDTPRDYSLPGVVPAPAVEAYSDGLEVGETGSGPAEATTPNQDENGDPAPVATPVPSAKQLLIEAIEASTPKWVGVMTESGDDDAIDEFALTVGRQPDIVQIAIGWEMDEWDSDLVDRITARGSVLMISWEPWDYRQKINPEDQPKYSLTNILNGSFDDYIDDWAEGLAADGRPVLLRFAHEMNGNWYPWDEQVNGNAPGSYVETWHYIQARFAAAGADNVIWVWSPNTAYPGSLPMAGLFPGSDSVDLLGLVGYFGHFSKTPAEFPKFDTLFGPTLAEIRAIDDRPVLITETSSTEVGGYKAGWVADFLATVAVRDDISGFVWFDVIKETNWRVDSSPEAQAAFLAGLEHPAYSPGP